MLAIKTKTKKKNKIILIVVKHCLIKKHGYSKISIKLESDRYL